MAGLLQLVLALTPLVALHNDWAPAGRAAKRSRAASAGDRNFKGGRFFFMGLLGLEFLCSMGWDGSEAVRIFNFDGWVGEGNREKCIGRISSANQGDGKVVRLVRGLSWVQ